MWDCRDGARFFVPHKTGRRYSDYIVEWDEWDKSDKVVPIRVSRAVAIRLLDDCWEAFKHAGNVPGIAERLACQSVMGLRSTFPPHPVAAACRSNAMWEGSGHGVSHTQRWMIDSGIGWDLVKSSHVSHLQDLIRTPQYCPRIWTANGVIMSDQEVPLYIAELQEKCVPYILKNTPDVLTMGRRCMCEGYSFVWKANSNKQFFRRPHGKRIFLIVDH